MLLSWWRCLCSNFYPGERDVPTWERPVGFIVAASTSSNCNTAPLRMLAKQTTPAIWSDHCCYIFIVFFLQCPRGPLAIVSCQFWSSGRINVPWWSCVTIIIIMPSPETIQMILIWFDQISLFISLAQELRTMKWIIKTISSLFAMYRW